MSTTDMILNFAGKRDSFTLCELAHYVKNREEISDSGILWHIKKLISQNKLARLSRGLYGRFTKKIFAPTLTEDIKELYKEITTAFPLIDVVVYSGQDVTALQHHLSTNNALYIEVTKEATEAVFHYLLDNKVIAYHKPDAGFMSDYVDLSERCIIVKPLITEAPINKIEGINMPTLEKLLVDINADSDFYYIQGAETSYIMNNAQSLYQLNFSKIFRYASRRGLRKKIQSYLSNNE